MKLFKSNEVNSIISDNNFPNFLSVQEKHYVHMLNIQENTFLSYVSYMSATIQCIGQGNENMILHLLL